MHAVQKSAPTVSLLCLIVLVSQAGATTYTGQLTYNTGLFATQNWADPATTLSWIVTDEEPDPLLPSSFCWKYTYTLSVPEKGISHMIVEASNGADPFTDDNIRGVSGITGVAAEIEEYSSEDQGNSNPLMPEPLYGIKLEGWRGDPTLLSLSFYSNRVPVWGDFYAKDGVNKDENNVKHPVVLYNTGFTAPDPSGPADNGSLNGHLLVPDTHTVPEPGFLTLLVLGGLGLRRNKR
ncbi:MAG: hypothetical protein JXA11_13120 [Phycisphaerae bacterium]|nr:hypothetical protein [Phycisphaerae bacterium]